MAAYARELADRQGDVASGTEARNGNSRLVYGERRVAGRCEVQTADVVERAWERVPGRLRVVERYDEDVVRVCKVAVPFVVIVGVSKAEPAAMYGEERREILWGGLVVRCREKDATSVSPALSGDCAMNSSGLGAGKNRLGC